MTLSKIAFVYLGLILGVTGGVSCTFSYPSNKVPRTVYVLSGCMIGVLVSIVAMDMGVSKLLLLFIITVSYVGASIAGRVVKR